MCSSFGFVNTSGLPRNLSIIIMYYHGYCLHASRASRRAYSFVHVVMYMLEFCTYSFISQPFLCFPQHVYTKPCARLEALLHANSIQATQVGYAESTLIYPCLLENVVLTWHGTSLLQIVGYPNSIDSFVHNSILYTGPAREWGGVLTWLLEWTSKQGPPTMIIIIIVVPTVYIGSCKKLIF